jgi:hypothetical protein
MESSRLTLPIIALVAALSLPAGVAEVSSGDPIAQHRRHEVARLRAHFDSVDRELRLATRTALTSAQLASRTTLVGWLREYRNAGVFPQNDRFPDRALPFFRDSRGVLCAMAYLIDRSGRGDLVDRVAASRNNGFIPELADDPDLRAWLDSVGLSVDEAARIQPWYGHPPEQPEQPEEQDVSTGYALSSVVAGGTSFASMVLNAVDPSPTASWLGLVAGAAAVVTGAVGFDNDGPTDDVAAANAIAGGGALMFGAYRLLAASGGRTIRPAASAGQSSNFSVSPVVTQADRGPRVGIAVHGRF